MVSQSVQQPRSTEARFFYGYILVMVFTFIQMVVFGVLLAFGVFFKPMLIELGWTRALTSGAFSLSWIMQGLLTIFMGRLSDRVGPRLVMTLAGLILGLGYLLMSQISDVWQMYLFYGVIIGSGMGSAWIAMMSSVARWFIQRRSMMAGIIMAGAGIGTLIMSPIANWLISAHGWRISYIILGGIVMVLVLLASQFIKRDPSTVGQRPYGENRAGESMLELEASGFSLKQAVNTNQFWLFFGMNACLGFSFYVVTVHIAPHATELGISTASAANILATMGGFATVGRVLLGIVADRIGNRLTFIIGFILMAGALLWLAPASGEWTLYIIAAFFGFAVGAAAATPSLAAELFGLSSHGLILGVTALGYCIGSAAGPFVAGYIFDVTSSYQVAFLASAGLSVAGIILALLLRPIHRNEKRALSRGAIV